LAAAQNGTGITTKWREAALSRTKAVRHFLRSDSDNLTGHQRFEGNKHSRHQRNEVVYVRCVPFKYNDRQCAVSDVLLLRKILIYGNQHVKARVLGGGQQFAVGKATEPGEAACLAIEFVK
jgi:hypothetical protein